MIWDKEIFYKDWFVFVEMDKRGLIFVFILLILPLVSAESCFVELEVNEDKVGEDVVFSLRGLENLYGNLEGLVREYYEELGSAYILNVYDDSGVVIGRYGMESSRFAIIDHFGEEVSVSHIKLIT